MQLISSFDNVAATLLKILPLKMPPREQDPGKEDHQRPQAPEPPRDQGEEDPEEEESDDEDDSDEEIEIPLDPVHEATMSRLREENEFLLRQQEQEGELLRQEIALRDQVLSEVQRLEERHRELILQREQREQQDQESSPFDKVEDESNNDKNMS